MSDAGIFLNRVIGNPCVFVFANHSQKKKQIILNFHYFSDNVLVFLIIWILNFDLLLRNVLLLTRILYLFSVHIGLQEVKVQYFFNDSQNSQQRRPNKMRMFVAIFTRLEPCSFLFLVHSQWIPFLNWKRTIILVYKLGIKEVSLS